MGTKKKENASIDLSAVKPESDENDASSSTEAKYVGVVTGCQYLNVRCEPVKDSDVVSVLRAETEVVVDKTSSTKEFYKVCTSAGIDGYCVRRYIRIK